MASGHAGTVLKELATLLGMGTLAGMSDADLLGRFAARRDEAAFEALVERHGPMVLRVCRELLSDRHLAEDAFQAVFVVLARRAGTIRDPDRLGPWLYGVALRTAKEAKARLERQRRREVAMNMESLRGVACEEDRTERCEQADALHEEIGRLPEKYRAAVVLCYFEGLTHEEAAGRLRTPAGTIGVRLMRARERLRSRLMRRGLAPGVAQLAASPRGTEAAVPPDLLDATVRAATATGAVGALPGGVLKAMALTRLARVVAVSLVLALAAVAAGGWLRAATALQTPTKPAEGRPVAQKVQAPAETFDLLVTDGRTGKPLTGASVVEDDWTRPHLTTDDQGHCRIPLPADLATEKRNRGYALGIRKDGFAPVQVSFTYGELRARKVRSHTVALEPAGPMGGLVTDEEGRPIAGAEVGVLFIATGRSGYHGEIHLDANTRFTTDAHGRWHARMLPGGERRVDIFGVLISHPDYVSDVWKSTRPIPTVESLRAGTYVATMKAGVPVSGMVVDPQGGPVPGASVSLNWSELRGEGYTVRTAADGRFRFAQARPGPQAVTVESDGFAPEMTPIEARPSLEPLTIRLGLGRTLRGRVVDAKGQPVRGAVLRVESWRSRKTLLWETKTDADGRFVWEHAPDDPVVLATRQSLVDPVRARTQVPPGAADVAITLKTATRLSGTVTDAQTGRPIASFRLVRGIQWGKRPDGQDRLEWQFDNVQSFTRGHYEADFDSYVDTQLRCVRIEADGYLPAESRLFRGDESDQVFDVELHKGDGIGGVIRSPDGAPLEGAEVVVVTPSTDLVSVTDGHLPKVVRAAHLRTGPDGHFAFVPPTEPFGLLVLSDRGMALKPAAELGAARDVRLEPWGRIEGTVRIGMGVGSGVEVQTLRQRYAGPDGPKVVFWSNSKTDARGRFTSHKVPSGPARVGYCVAQKLLRAFPTHLVWVDVEAGEAASVTLGGTGRAVIGQIARPPETASLLDFSEGRGLLEPVIPAPQPPDFAAWPFERKQAWWDAFYLTEAGQAYERRLNWYAAELTAEGHFRFPDVPPGHYKLSLHFEKPLPQQPGQAAPKLVGSVQREMDVPDDRKDEPLDLGTVEMTLANFRHVEVGDPAPGFAIKTLDGKPLALEDYRGKFVLLDFWATWCTPCLAETPFLKATFEAFGKDERFVVLGLSLDEEPEAPRAYATKNGLAWPQGFLGAWAASSVPPDYGVQGIPSVWLIGPDGKVVAKDLRGTSIKEAVARALGRE